MAEVPMRPHSGSAPGPLLPELRLRPILPAAFTFTTLPLALGLFVAPESSSDIWPWPLTPRAVGAGLIGLAVASAWALWERDWARVSAPAVSFAAFGALELAALVRFEDSVAWDTWEAWALVALLASFLAVGLESLRHRDALATTAQG